jgi:hypothetical protein
MSDTGEYVKVVVTCRLRLGAVMKSSGFSPAGLPITVPSSVSVRPLDFPKVVSPPSSSIVLSCVPRPGRGAWYDAAGSRKAIAIGAWLASVDGVSEREFRGRQQLIESIEVACARQINIE